MPVKRRNAKRRISTEQLFQVWQSVLETGYDFFSELRTIGVQTDQHRQPEREEAREAWRVFGGRVLAERDAGAQDPWGLTEFGDPTGGNHAG